MLRGGGGDTTIKHQFIHRNHLNNLSNVNHNVLRVNHKLRLR